MKSLLIAACFAGFTLVAGALPGHARCRVTAQASVEVSGEFSLADILGAGTCSNMRRAAATVPLGSAPVAGSVRVLAGNEVRAALQKLAAGLEQDAGELVTILVPERITVRRAGARASCADISRRIPVTSAGTADCGAADRIPQDASLEFSPPAWDPALRSWQWYARCVLPADCVPFLVRLRGRNVGEHAEAGTAPESGKARSTMARLAAASFLSRGQAASGPAGAPALVRPGQAVTLLWDQDGIRLVIPAVALDRGAPGERVRARIVRGGAVLDAIVVSAGMLRAVS